MKMIGSDPDIQTIIARILSGDINLQPEFQRGEVWGEAKKRRLIDTILRQWHVPPIHVVEVKETAELEVLDGQQRLVAIRDFVQGHITVDGHIQPKDPEILKLDGCTYDQLPMVWKRKFNQFTIRMFIITDYEPEEPGELFYRLNQPTNLTAAEQRNAFFGPAREQVKNLVKRLERNGINHDSIGFANSRMAYDDVLAKLCLTLDLGTLHVKVTSASITSKFRSKAGFSPLTVRRVESAIDKFADELRVADSQKFNKATLYSWLLFTVRLQDVCSVSWKIGHFIRKFEQARLQYQIHLFNNSSMDRRILEILLAVFNDRASSRVNDVSSILARDMVLWIFFTIENPTISLEKNFGDQITYVLHELVHNGPSFDMDRILNDLALQCKWGAAL